VQGKSWTIADCSPVVSSQHASVTRASHVCIRPQVEQKRKAAAMAALDKAEKKLSMAREELTKAEAVLQFATTQEALASRFRFSSENIVTHENKDGEWLVCTISYCNCCFQ
jgi:hypothetical protein